MGPKKRARDVDDAPESSAPPTKKGKGKEVQDESTAPAPKTKKAKGKQVDEAPTKRKLPTTEEATQAMSKANRALAACVNEILFAKDPVMRNARRIAKTLQDVKAARVVKASLPDPSLADIRVVDVIASDPVRDIRPLDYRKDNTQGRWQFRFSKGNSTSEAKGSVIHVNYTTVLAADTPKADLAKFHQELARIWSAWPWFDNVKAPVKEQFVFIAAANIFARPMVVDIVDHGEGVTYQTKVHYILPDTGAHKRLTVAANATKLAVGHVTVPALPVFQIHDTGNKTIIPVTPQTPYHANAPKCEKLGKNQVTSQKLQHTAEDAVYWLSVQLQGLVATEQRMKDLLAMYRTSIGLQKAARMQTGLYGDEADLYWTYFIIRDHSTGVAPTLRIAKDLGLTRQELMLYVHSLNASRATPIMDTVIQLFCDGHEIRYVWLEAAKIADYVNLDIADGVPPSSQCDCTAEMTGTELHACEGCGNPTLCKIRAFDSKGRLVCVRCATRDRMGLGAHARPTNESLAASRARASFWRNFKNECRVNGMDPNSASSMQIFNTAWEELKKRLPGGGDTTQLSDQNMTDYVDEYTQLQYDLGSEVGLVGNNPSRRRYVPHGITIDAVHRQGHPDQQGLKHSVKNLRITSNACQMEKGSFNAGAIHAIGEFKRLSPEKQATEVAQNQLINVTTEMAMVNCKRRYINGGTGTAEQKYQKILAESTAGKLTPNEPGPWEQEAQQYVEKRVTLYQGEDTSIWEDGSWDKAQECARSTAKYFGVTLYKLPDGTFWTGTKHSNPETLIDRNGIGQFCIERLARMRIICNKKWRTVDSWYALYREIIFQYCCSKTKKPQLQWLKKKYGDRLGLPLVLTKHNPLRMSVAHRTHGFGMVFGWTSGHPTDVQDRIDNDAKNNSLLEAWGNNSAKLDMAEDYYPDLDKILCAVNITDKSIYNPDLPLSGFVGQPLLDATQLGRKQDDFFLSGLDAVEEKHVLDADGDDQEGEPAGVVEDVDFDEPGGAETYGAGGGAGDAGDDDDEPARDFDDEFSHIYQELTKFPALSDKLSDDPDLQQLITELQNHGSNGDGTKFDEIMGAIYQDFINPAKMEMYNPE